MGKGVWGATLCQGHLSATHPIPHPMPGVDPLASHPREGKGPPVGDARWRKGLLRCLLPVPAAPLTNFPARGPRALVWGRRWLSLSARGPFSQRPVVGWDIRLLPLTLPTLPSRSCPPSGWHPKGRSRQMRGCLASLGVPCPLALVGGPPQATPGQSPPSDPIREPVPAGLEMLYI